MSLKALEKVLAGNITAEKDRLQRECERIKKEMKAEKTAHDQQMTKEKQAFETYQGECNIDIAKRKKFLNDSINELAGIEDSRIRLSQEEENVEKKKEEVKALATKVKDAQLAAARAEEKAKKAEDLYTKKLLNIK